MLRRTGYVRVLAIAKIRSGAPGFAFLREVDRVSLGDSVGSTIDEKSTPPGAVGAASSDHETDSKVPVR